jgi:hypothetical protein
MADADECAQRTGTVLAQADDLDALAAWWR